MREFHETITWDEDGNPLIWGKELVTDASPEELLVEGHDLLVAVASTMSHVEKHDLLVARVLIVGDHVIAETDDNPFENWDTGEVRSFEESFPCPDCGRTVQWAEPMREHDDDCPYVVVREVMLR